MDHLLSIGSVIEGAQCGLQKNSFLLKPGTVNPHSRGSGFIFLSPGLACADGGGSVIRHQAGGENHWICWTCALQLSPASQPPWWRIAASILAAGSACSCFWMQPGVVCSWLAVYCFTTSRPATGSSSCHWNYNGQPFVQVWRTKPNFNMLTFPSELLHTFKHAVCSDILASEICFH